MANEKHLLLTARGTYGFTPESDEIWQNGIRLVLVFGSVDADGNLPNNYDVDENNDTRTDSGVSYVTNWKASHLSTFNFDPIQYLIDYGVPSWATFMATSTFSSHLQMTDLALYPIGSNGKAIEGRSAHATWAAPVSGGGDSDLMPLEVARVVSWQTPRIGRRGRGRIYLAGSSKVDCTTHGEIDGTRCGTFADAAQALLEGLSYSSSDPADAHVRPIVTGSPWTDYGMITGLSVGNVFDAQRRRRNRLSESRVTRSPSYG
jgi:hypothetical protein